MHIRNDNNLYPRFSDSEFANRYARVRASMQEAGLSALILHGTAGSYQEIQFLTNFLVTREAMLVFSQVGEPTMFVQYYNHLPNARRVSFIEDIHWGGKDIAATTANNVQERGLAQSHIGIIGTIPLKHYDSVRQALPQATFVYFASLMSVWVFKWASWYEYLAMASSHCTSIQCVSFSVDSKYRAIFLL